MDKNSIFNQIDCVIFDMDGLMFGTEIMAERIWKSLLTEHNLVPNQEFLNKIKGRNIPDQTILFKKYYNSNLDYSKLKEERNIKLEHELRIEGVPLKKGLVECLNYLKSINKTLAVASSSDKHLILDNLKDTNLLSYFSHIVSGEDFKQSKPNPEIFLNVSEHLKIKPERCMVLEDSEAGITAALRANMQAVWIPDLVFFSIPKEVIKLNSLLDILHI